MSGKNVQVFAFEQQEVRIVEQDGVPWWVAKDVCDVLGLGNITETLRNLDEDELTSVILKSGGQDREMRLVSEAGLYSLILRSRKPEAKRFKRWVTHEVLPAIRKTGAYVLPGSESVMKALTNPDNLMAILGNWKKDRDRRLELERKVQDDNQLALPLPRRRRRRKRPFIFVPPARGYYTAKQLAEEFETSRGYIGQVANRYKLKAPMGERNDFGYWYAFEKGKRALLWAYSEFAREWMKSYFAAMWEA